MPRADGTHFHLVYDERIKIRCYNICRGDASIKNDN
jgi:hypothetical protein